MKLARIAAVGVAALGLVSLQVALGSAAQADDFGSLKLTPWGYEPGHQTSVVSQAETDGSAIWVTGPAGAKIDANVLVTVKTVGSTSAMLPAGVSLTFPNSSCTPAVPGADPAQTGTFLCDMTKVPAPTIPPAPPGSSPGPATARADVVLKFADGTTDGQLIQLSQTLVPHADMTLAQIEADQKAGKVFDSDSHTFEVESQARAAQGKASPELADFMAGETTVQTVKVHAADHPDLAVKAEDAVAGESWNPSAGPIDLPPGLDLLGVSADNGAECRSIAVDSQHVRTGEDQWLAFCDLAPGDTTVKLTFRADAALKTTHVKLSAEYNVYAQDGLNKPVSTGTGTFTVKAVTTQAAATSVAATPTAAATPAAAGQAAASAAKPSATASRSGAHPGAQLAETGAGNTVGYAMGGALVLAAGAGILIAARRRGAQA